jgi:hypothetical protein
MPDTDVKTTRSLAALFESLIDYAGLFPPAKLDMRTTVRNYAEYLRGGDAWMLGRLIVPASRLDEFEHHATKLVPTGEDDEPWLLSVLTAAAGDPQLTADLDRIEAFNESHDEAANGLSQIDVIELKADNAQQIDAALEQIPDELFACFEIPIDDDPRGLIAALVGVDTAAKVRTGGLTADAYPSPVDLARFIVACAGAGVPFKATAGMHHPLRHFNPAVKAKEFGFLNVFAAACLAERNRLDLPAIVRVLEAESIESFAFTDQLLRVERQEIRVEQIEAARDQLAMSFGSCSFDEPRADLRKLGLLT